MSYIKTPMKGMNDYLPSDMRLREYVMNKIKKTYGKYGFSQIETPAIEHIENLTSKQGGENEKLIFKILKRGEKLESAKNEGDDSLCDCGLRYDLTVPLSRYYANNSSLLSTPFKALQIGNVWRADRPQKGRFRQFTQCDIDILGDESILAEIELVSATASMLAQLGFTDLKVRINDRRILKAMALSCGFPEESLDKVFIILDKMDKIGLDGVEKELKTEGFDRSSVEGYCKWFKNLDESLGCKAFCGNNLEGQLDGAVLDNLDQIISGALANMDIPCRIVFDPTLVRGMSYYTGTIFEIELPDFGSSVAGGGRYDEMIGKFSNTKVCACGFSIGFERIITMMKERNYVIPGESSKVAFLIDKSVKNEGLADIFKEAQALRKEDKTVMVTKRNKNVKHQKQCLEAEGYTEFKEFFGR